MLAAGTNQPNNPGGLNKASLFVLVEGSVWLAEWTPHGHSGSRLLPSVGSSSSISTDLFPFT